MGEPRELTFQISGLEGQETFMTITTKKVSINKIFTVPSKSNKPPLSDPMLTYSFLLNNYTREMLVAIIFGGFENITIWRRFNLAILLGESGWGQIFFIW